MEGATPPADSRAVSAGSTPSGFRWAAGICALVFLVTAVLAVLLPDRAALLTVRTVALGSFVISGLVCLATAGARHGADRVWRLLVAVMVLAVAVASAAVFRDVLAGGPPVPRPTPASMGYLAPWALGVAGVLLYPSEPFDASLREPGGRRDRRWYAITILDSVILVGAAAFLAWVTVLQRAVEDRGTLAEGSPYSAVIGAASLIVTVIVILVATFRQPRSGLGLYLLIMGLLACTGTILWQVSAVVRGLADTPRLTDLGFLAGPLLIGLAALAPDMPRPARAPPAAAADATGTAARRRWHAALPYLPLIAAGVVAVTEISGEKIAHPEAIWALLALLVIALVRQMATMAENVRLLGEVEEKQAQLRYRAFHDPLTGLANRALFSDRLDQALASWERHARRFAVLFCDLDDFKRVNDALGHAAGDELLRVTARRLTATVRASDTVARLGGDEFALLVESEDPVAVGERVAEAVRAPTRLAGLTCSAAASVGLVVVDGRTGPVSAEALMRRADLAMYAAKSRHKGELTIYTPDLSAPQTRPALHAALAAAARSDPAGGTLTVGYQPVMDLTTNTVAAYDAHLTWTHPQFGTMPAATLLPTADSLGLAPALDQLLVHRACTEFREQPTPLHITISAGRAGRPTLVREVVEALRAADLPPTRLVVQIRPTLHGSDLTAAAATLARLHAGGIRIGLRDVGAPDTTIDAVIDILGLVPIDTITLDRTLTQAWLSPGAGRRAALAADFLASVLGLGIAVIAADVDGTDTATRLRAQGCHLALGRAVEGARHAAGPFRADGGGSGVTSAGARPSSW